ncbi:hypothetical protein TNCV_544671 [Trichonephila clavipes]|nr:hypothetical protein TNCV_544671 [Trichonephila clavipes]
MVKRRGGHPSWQYLFELQHPTNGKILNLDRFTVNQSASLPWHEFSNPRPDSAGHEFVTLTIRLPPP